LQVSDADVVQELQALTDLTEHQPGDAALLLRDRLLERQRPLERAPCREPGELVDRHPGHQHGPRLGPQPRPLALRTRPERHVLLDLLAGEVRVGLPVAALEPGHDPLELGGVRTAAPEAVAIRDLDSIAVGPIEEELARLLRQLLPRRLEIDSVALRDRLRELVVVVRSAHRPRRDRALADRERGIRDHEVRVDLHLRAQAGAAWTRPVRRVEREDPRLELGEARTVDRTGELLAEQERLARLR